MQQCCTETKTRTTGKTMILGPDFFVIVFGASVFFFSFYRRSLGEAEQLRNMR